MSHSYFAESSKVRQDTRLVLSSILTAQDKEVSPSTKSSVSVTTHSTNSQKPYNGNDTAYGIPSSIFQWQSWLDLKSSPWVLVADGSLLGYFNWVPIQYRIGPWHPISKVALVLLVVGVVYTIPWTFVRFVAQDFHGLFMDMSSATNLLPLQGDASITWNDPAAMDTFASTTVPLPESFPVSFMSYCIHARIKNPPIEAVPTVTSWHFYFNALLFIYMTGHVVVLSIRRTPGILATFTIQSWWINSVRFGIQTILALMHCTSSFGRTYCTQEPSSVASLKLFSWKTCICWSLQVINEILRFPALATATITFVMWNLILFPYLCTYFFSNSKKRRRDFIRWNLSFNLVQIHFCNIYYSIMNVFVTEHDNSISRFLSWISNVPSSASTQHILPPTTRMKHTFFQYHDLWFGICHGVLYTLFYVLVLDRLGIHIYGPLLSPRNKLSALMWFCVILIYFCTFSVWNFILSMSLPSTSHRPSNHHDIDPHQYGTRSSLLERNETIMLFWQHTIPCYGGIICLLAWVFSIFLRRYVFVPMEDKD